MTDATAQPTLEVAAFDFDGTLTRRDTLLPYLARYLGWPRFLGVLLLCSPWLAAYACRLMSNHKAKARLLKLSLGGRSEAEIASWSADFVANYLPQQWQADMLARMRQHQRQGHRCVMVSASLGIYLHPVGEMLGLDAVICTELEVKDGALTGYLATPNCYGEEKVRRLQAWLANQGLNAALVLHVYGDSRGDVPLLNLADYAWYKGQPRARPASAN
ncbi:HAD family hydrolase [Polaromonas sp. SM01]|uniref:HAD family hydrolase n=1 Tax=Polaromonas sp. SM01 TaxID=3085630 RepID=UPI002981E1C5|nr:HAD family hydrolase [Polaromonas sp. SM01]MDW5443902.1 HAD family hydrolase [Polaromonas sp. SM01]